MAMKLRHMPDCRNVSHPGIIFGSRPLVCPVRVFPLRPWPSGPGPHERGHGTSFAAIFRVPLLGCVLSTRAPYWIKGLNFACHKTRVLWQGLAMPGAR